MQTSLVITVIGPDRPGLVDSLSTAINENGGNWTQSRMAHLAGQFAGILHVQLEDNAADRLRTSLADLTGEDLQITVAVERLPESEASGLSLNLELVGQDRPGIVKEVSHVLASLGVNVEELSTECESAPWSGEMLFKAHATLRAPADVDIDALRSDLEAVAQDLMVDVNLVRPL